MTAFRPIKVVDLALDGPLPAFEGLDGYGSVQALVRLHGVPLGWVSLPVRGGRVSRAALAREIVGRHGAATLRHWLADRLEAPLPREGLGLRALFAVAHAVPAASRLLVTVAVCTRGRPAGLARCLASLAALDYPALDLLVVDNAPTNDAAERVVGERAPRARYVREPRPGLNWARNRAIAETRGEIIAYTDDDVVVDPGWVGALAAVFAAHADVAAVTGMVAPYVLDTEAQVLFEMNGGFTRGLERRFCRADPARGRVAAQFGNTGQLGTGANMAFRRRVFDAIGGFDPALDAGTPTRGGGDLDMFFRVLKHGYALVYEPAALVRHEHRTDHGDLRRQLVANSVGFVSYLVRSARAYPEERVALLRLWLRLLRRWHLRRIVVSFVRPGVPRDLALAELWGALVGFPCYARARRSAERIAAAFGVEDVRLAALAP